MNSSTSFTDVRLEPVADPEAWNAICSGFRDAEFTQSYEWGQAREGWQPVRWVLTDGQTPIAAAQLLVKSRFGLRLIYCPRGPVWQRRETPLEQSLAGLGRFLDALVRAYRGAVFVCDWYADREELPEDVLKTRGFRRVTEGMTAIIDLQADLEAIRASFHRKWRNDLQKAEQSPLEIRRHEPGEFLAELYVLAGATAERKKFVVGVGQAVAERFLSARAPGSSAIFTAVNPDGSVASAALIVRFNGMASYLIGASVHKDHQAFSRGASNLVQWSAIQWAKASGSIAYNLEGLDPVGNPGVYHFKERMNGRPRQTRGMWVWTRSRPTTALARVALRRMVP